MQLEKLVSLGQYGHLKRLQENRSLFQPNKIRSYATALPLDNFVSASFDKA